MKKKHTIAKRLFVGVLSLAMVFTSLSLPNTVQAMGTNTSTLDPTSWIGSGDGAESIKAISYVKNNIDYDLGISLTLMNDGTFQLNAPSLVSGFRYFYLLDGEEYAEYSSKYKIFSTRQGFVTYYNNNGGYCDTQGDGNSTCSVQSNGILNNLAGVQLLNLMIVEDRDYNDVTVKTNNGRLTLRQYTGMTYGWGDFEIPYGVLFNVGSDHGTAPNAISYDASGNVKLPNVASDYQYLFDGWYTAASGGTKIGGAGQTVNWSNSNLKGYKNTTLYAHWKTHNHKWNYVAGTGSDSNKIYAYCYGSSDGLQCPYYSTSGKNASSPYVELTTPSDKTYDGTTLGTASASASSNWSITGNSVPTVTYSPALDKNAGTYTASIKVGSTTASKAVKINQREVSVTAPTVASLTYKEQEQALLADSGTINNAIASDGMKLEYRLVKINNDSSETELSTWSESIPQAKNVGDYKVYYKIKNADGFITNYKIGDTDKDGSKFVQASIEKDTAVASTVPSALNLTYNGTNQTLISAGASTTGTIKYRLGTTGEWSEELPTGKDAKDYEVYYKVFGDANHNDSAEIKIENTKIKKKVITSLDWTNDSFTYDKDSHKPTVTVNASDVCAGDSLAVTVEGEQKNASATPYTVTATGLTGTGSENYELTTTEGVIKHNFTINPVVVTIDWSNTTLTYNGESQTPTATVKGVLDGETCTATVTGGKVDANTSANPSYTATVAADALSSSNYKLNADATIAFTINPRPVALTWSTTDLTYTGAEQIITASVSNKVGSDTFTLTYENNTTDKKVNKATNVDTYTAVVTGLGNANYTLTGAENVSKEWKISYLDANAVVSGTKKIEDSGWYTSEVTVKPETAGFLISEDKNTWSDSIVRNTDGTHTVEYYIKDTNGFITDKKTATFKIDTTVPTGTITIKDNSFTEFLNTITFGNFFKDTVDVKIEGADPKADGVDAVSGIGKIEYQKVGKGETYSADGTWTTGNNFSVKANEKFVVYARITDKAGNVTIINSEGQVVYTDATASDSVEYIKTSTDDKATNIAIGVNTIKAITYKDVTTSAGAGTEIKNLPADGYELVDGKIVLKNKFLKDLQVGSYEITVLYNPYGETFVNGQDANPSTISLKVINQADFTLENTSYTKTYGDEAFTVGTTDKIGVSDITYTSADEKVVKVDKDGKVTITGAGETKITVAMAESTYYQAVSKEVTVKVVPKPITVKADDKTVTYGDEEAKLTFTADGLVGTDKLTDITLTRAEGKDVGSYDITATQKDKANGNYSITFKTGTYTIEKKSITGAKVTLGSKLVANGSNQAQAVESVEIDGLKATFDVTDNSGKDAGKYTMKITGNGNFKDTIEQTFVIVDPDKPADDGKVKVEVKVDPKAPETEMATPKKDLMNIVMDADDAAAVADGAELDIWLEVKDASSTITPESKKQIENGTDGYNIGQYIDISLFKKLSTETEKTQITGTSKNIKIQITIPDNLVNKNSKVTRTYAIVRNHDGKVEILGTSYDEKNQTLTFETDKFSDYAIIYKDTDKADDDPSQPTDPTKPTDPKKATSPKTGDDFDLTRYLLLMMAGLLGMVGCVVYKKKEEKE